MATVFGFALSVLLVVDLSDHYGRYLALGVGITIGIGALLLARYLQQSAEQPDDDADPDGDSDDGQARGGSGIEREN